MIAPHVIFHLDLDSFFVSAERLRRPDLIGIPVAVGGGMVISSASYESRKFGVRSAMPTQQALRLCPQLKVVKPDFKWYSQLSRQVFDIVSRFSPVVEKVSVDEAYIDMRGTTQLYGSSREAAERMRREIREGTGLAASVGIGTNRRIAKIASDFAKPDGVYVVESGKEREFLGPLEIRRVPGIGKVTEEGLHRERIFRISDLFGWSDEQLEKRFGANFGKFLASVRDGRGSTEFFEEAKTRSMSREETFAPPLSRLHEIKHHLWELVADLGQDLRSEREEDEKVYARTVRLKLRYANFETPSRARTLPVPTRADREIYEAAEALLVANWDTARPIRLLGVGVALGSGEFQQDLFSQPKSDRAERIDELKDTLRAKFGATAAKTGRDLLAAKSSEAEEKRRETEKEKPPQPKARGGSRLFGKS